MAYLGVSNSVSGRRWVGPDPAAERLAEALAQDGHPVPLAQHLARRGVLVDDAAGFLAPTLRDALPDPLSLRDMDRAAARLVDAATGGERIAVFADYDVDGGASAALLSWWLRGLGRSATIYVPDRITEGYGPNPAAIAGLAADHDLILCVDCGTLSHDALRAAQGRADVVVLDHHLGGETLPPALAVVNPNRQDEAGTLSHLCAASVVFLCLVEANRILRRNGGACPDLMAMLDLVALATVADVAPLVGVNRALTRQGLRVMARRLRPGLVALADASRMDGPPSVYHLGYLLGPRINAGGRIGRADLGARLLSTADPDEAAAIAAQLDALNRDRQTIEAGIVDAALAQAEGRDGPLAWAAGPDWHPGIVGIVASRLKEATGRPSVVVGLRGDGLGQGSCRSVPGVDIGGAVQRLVAEGWLVKGGGHRMAAGLTVETAKLDGAMERLASLLEGGAGRGGPSSDLALDGTLMPAAATLGLVTALEAAGPFGQDAPAPRFALPGLRVAHARPVGDGHLKLSLSDGGARLDAIAFRASDALRDLAASGGGVHVAGRVEANRWQGRETVQIRVEDAAPADR